MSSPTVGLSLTVKDGNAALDFYTRAFNAKELYRMPMPDGSVAHSEFMIGNSSIYLSGESPEWKAFALPEGGISSCLFPIDSDDCDQLFAQAVEAGGTAVTEPQDQFWGWRTGLILDPFGYRWNVRQFLEEVSPEEMMRRAQEAMKG